MLPTPSKPAAQADGSPVSLEAASSPALRFLAAIVAAYGPTVRRLTNGKTELNHATMARLLAHRLGLAFDAATGEFIQLRPEPGTVSKIIGAELVKAEVIEVLQQMAAQHPGLFPMSALRPIQVKRLIADIKAVAEIVRADAPQSLRDYVHARLRPTPGHNVTVAEIHTEYLEHSRQRNLALLPRARFQKQLPRIILELFAIPRVNNVLRPIAGTAQLTARKGFNGLGFTDVQDETDGIFAGSNGSD